MNILTTHLLIIFLVIFLLQYIHRNLDWTLLLVIANVFTDVLKLLVFFLIDKYTPLLGVSQLQSILTATWISAGIIIVVSSFFLIYKQVIKKKKFSEHADLFTLLMVSFVLHAVMDLIFIERVLFI